jgi:PKD repeat protein
MKPHEITTGKIWQSGAPCFNLKLNDMQRFKRFALLLLACCSYLFPIAQTTNCSAEFTYSVGYNKVVSFIAKDTLGVTNRWSFGDGTSNFITQNGIIVHQYAQAGTYEVKHFIEKPNSNCRDSVVKTITVPWLDTCGASFEYHRVTGTATPFTFQFTNTSLSYSGVHTSAWKFGDGSSSGDMNPIHSFPHSGSYQVCLRIESNAGCVSEWCKEVIITDSNTCSITARYEYRKDSLNCKKINFINQSSPVSPNVHFIWKFGDGATSQDINPSHIYTQPGRYYVCLVSEAGINCRAEYCDSVTVVCEETCNIIAKYEYRRDSVDCKKIHFINQSISPTSNIHFAWIFGDGSGSQDINPIHVYQQTGKYYVCLVAESGTNCRKEFCDSIYVYCQNTCNVFAKFESKHDTEKWNLIHFSNLSQPINVIWKTYWTYGDGTSSQDFNTFHSYEKPGVYQVCLKVISLNGCISSYCDSVHINKPDSCIGKARFSYYHSLSMPLTVKFEALYSSSSARYYWTFGDGLAGTGRQVYHVYHKAGKYTVCLKVKDRECEVTNCEELTVGSDCDTIKVSFEYSGKPARPNEVTFKAISNEPLASQTWYISRISPNGLPILVAILRQNNPTFLFRDTGRYQVCLKGVTVSLCYKEYCASIHIEKVVNAPGTVNLSPNPASNYVTIEVNLDKPEQVFIRILDGSGAVKAEYSKTGATGNNRFTLPVQALSQGLYLVEIKTNTRKWLTRFVKA